jgi:threonine dehydrogenase-like Zn-dependent dehydrogenase
MKALALTVGTPELRLVERPEPSISQPDEVKVRTLRVGICGTDREEARGGRAEAPPGMRELVIGHEMLGEVVEVGSEVRRVKPGDLAVFTVRRGCGQCLPCAMNRSDMCRTGLYRERGIRALDGYQAHYVVDRECYVVHLPREVEAIGVLTEPLSVVEKAIDEAVRLQFARLPGALAHPAWLHGRRCLVAGLGPIGLLAAMALLLRGAEVHGLDIVPPDSRRPAWLDAIGGHYIHGSTCTPASIRDEVGAMQLIFEATGAPALAFNLLEALDVNGIYVLTGIPSNHRTFQLPAGELMRALVLDNQLMMGSVNAARDHFQLAVHDLLDAERRWPRHIEALITHRTPPEGAEALLHQHSTEEIKAVVEWNTTWG